MIGRLINVSLKEAVYTKFECNLKELRSYMYIYEVDKSGIGDTEFM